MHIHQEKLSQIVLIVWLLLFKTRSGAARLWQEYFHNEVCMSAGWNAEAVEMRTTKPSEDLNDNDDASMYGHSDRFMVELKVDVFQDVKAMKKHKSGHRSVDNHWNCGQDREASLHVGQIEAEHSG